MSSKTVREDGAGQAFPAPSFSGGASSQRIGPDSQRLSKVLGSLKDKNDKVVFEHALKVLEAVLLAQIENPKEFALKRFVSNGQLFSDHLSKCEGIGDLLMAMGYKHLTHNKDMPLYVFVTKDVDVKSYNESVIQLFKKAYSGSGTTGSENTRVEQSSSLEEKHQPPEGKAGDMDLVARIQEEEHQRAEARKREEELSLAFIRQMQEEDRQAQEARRMAAEDENERLARQLQEQFLQEEREARQNRKKSEHKMFLDTIRGEKKRGRRLTVMQSNLLNLEVFYALNNSKRPSDPMKPTIPDCPVCMSDELTLHTAFMFPCGHSSCLECAKEHVSEQCTDQKKCQSIRCTQAGCKSVVPSDSVGLLVDPETNAKYSQFLLNAHLDSDEDTRRCIKPGCEGAVIGVPGVRMVRCPTCEFAWCSQCQVEWHADSTCAQYQQWKKDNENGSNLFDAWRQRNTKACPKCRGPIQKNGGCNHMTCRCGYQFCWLCMQKYSSSHFSKTSCKQFT